MTKSDKAVDSLVLLISGKDVRCLCDVEQILPLVEDAFLSYGKGESRMPSKVYLDLPEYKGDFRAMHRLSFSMKGTDFQETVWRALCAIEPGTTQSYGDIARSIGNPKACRAVGMANRLNPIALVVPCHRVIGANGSLTGFAGGLGRKQWLLQHERKWA